MQLILHNYYSLSQIGEVVRYDWERSCLPVSRLLDLLQNNFVL